MDQVKSHHIESLSKTQYLIKLTQLLVSVSLCSFLFPPSSLLAFFHHFNFYFSTFPSQLFTHAIDKNCMFLLCNGLLVFVGITRSFSNGSSGDHHHHEVDSKYGDYDDGSRSQFSDVEAKERLLEKEGEGRSGGIDDEQNICAEQVIEIKYSDDEVEEDDIEKAIVEDDDEEEEKIASSQSDLEIEGSGKLDAGDEGEEVEGLLIEENLEEEEEIEDEEEDIEDDDEEEEEEENCLLSTEELNKKFDDFIRRMREDLRLEAQRQLIMV